MRHTDQRGFVIHARDYGDTSQILDLITEQHGRVSLVHKGGRVRKRNGPGRMQPFNSYSLGWTGRSSLKTLVNPQCEETFLLSGTALVAGFYINELVWYLVQHEDECLGIFNAYENCLASLASEGGDLEVTLRYFERRLLDELGYMPQWTQEAETGQPIEPDRHYYFRFGEGFYLSQGPDDDLLLSGEDILRIANEDYRLQETRRSAKSLFRRALAILLDGRELKSRKLLQSQETG